ncbi:hypothetical protein ACF0CL_10240, partial [Acinetobacter baumannii]
AIRVYRTLNLDRHIHHRNKQTIDNYIINKKIILVIHSMIKNISTSFDVALHQDLSSHFNLRISEILEVTDS